MVDTSIKIFKVRSEYIEEFKEWARVITDTLLADAVNSLIEENCLVEEVRILNLKNEIYIITTMISTLNKNIIKGSDTYINVKHRKAFSKVVEKIIQTKLVYKISQ